MIVWNGYDDGMSHYRTKMVFDSQWNVLQTNEQTNKQKTYFKGTDKKQTVRQAPT